MAETYCGKDCTACTYKEPMNCPGCLAGPGRPGSGDCDLARCCRAKGHQACVTCSYNVHCGTLRDKHRMPEYRQKKIEAERKRQASIAKRAPFLGKWLWLLFWLFIPSEVAGFFNGVSNTLPAMYLPGLILKTVCAAAYGCILLRLSTEEDRYRTAGICTLVASAAGVLNAFVPAGAESIGWLLLISVPAAVVSLVGEYNAFNAHATVLTGVNNILAQKWMTLWKWYIGMFGAMVGSLVVMFISPVLGLLVILAAAIGILVVSILKLVYLYQTAKAFREFRVTVM